MRVGEAGKDDALKMPRAKKGFSAPWRVFPLFCAHVGPASQVTREINLRAGTPALGEMGRSSGAVLTDRPTPRLLTSPGWESPRVA